MNVVGGVLHKSALQLKGHHLVTIVTHIQMSSNISTFEELHTFMSNLEEFKSNCDVLFIVINSFIIYFMQCGFAFLECGAVRSKNTTNILIKNVLDSFISGLAYWTVGWSLAFGEGNFFLGHSRWALTDTSDTQLATWFFHFVFAATATTIVSGALAERCEFGAYLCYSFLITGVAYPVVTHWAWSADGWLASGFTADDGDIEVTYQDFAGSGVVHLLGGTAALVAAALIGPRIGRFDLKGKPSQIKGHSVPLAALGGFILFFGFFAFNGGSQASISAPGDGAVVALSVTNTILSGSGAATVSLLIRRLSGACKKHCQSTWSLLVTINGGLTGMVAICAGCNVFSPWAAFVVGVVAGVVYHIWSTVILAIKVDDPLDAVAVHAGGGLWGVISVPIFARDTGIIYAWSHASGLAMAWNLVGAVAIIAWSAFFSFVVFGTLKSLRLFRVDRLVELRGLDIPKHDEPAYPVESYGHGWIENGSPGQDNGIHFSGSLGGIVHTIPNSDQGSQISTTNGMKGTKKQGYQNNAMNGYNPDQEGNISYNPDQDGIINGYYSGTLPQHISPVQSSSCVYTADADTPL